MPSDLMVLKNNSLIVTKGGHVLYEPASAIPLVLDFTFEPIQSRGVSFIDLREKMMKVVSCRRFGLISQ